MTPIRFSDLLVASFCIVVLKVFLNEVMQRKELDKVYGICVSENIASKKVLEKTGFKMEYEGVGEYQGERRQIAKYVLKRA